MILKKSFNMLQGKYNYSNSLKYADYNVFVYKNYFFTGRIKINKLIRKNLTESEDYSFRHTYRKIDIHSFYDIDYIRLLIPKKPRRGKSKV